MKVPQSNHAHSLIRDLRAINARAEAIPRTASQAALDWQPPAGGWSVGQIFEHLCVANDSYLVVLRRLVPDSRTGFGTANTLWKPSLAGRLLIHSMESPRKLSAPKIWRPGPRPRPNVISEFLLRQRELEELIARSLAYDWRRHRLASPASPLIRMNLGDAFTVLVRHEQRHFAQIDTRLAFQQRQAVPALAAAR
jgi:DinB family protein